MGVDLAVSNPDIYSEVPVFSLRPKTRLTLSQMMNPCKVIPSPEGLPRDWRGLSHLCEVTSQLNESTDPTGHILSLWEKRKPSPTVRQLMDFFGVLDRWDVLDDMSSLIEMDTKEFLQRKEKGVINDCNLVKLNADGQILTVDDIYRIEQGLQPQNYDAFLLFSDEDTEFAMKIVDKLENDFGHKLCLKDRDLVGGLFFEHEAIMQLIAERCNRLIIIISPAFLESQMNKFFVTFAQAHGIEQRQRKIIPCIYQKFSLPPQLRHYFVLDYDRAGHFSNFWNKLSQSLSSPCAQIGYRCQIKELPSSGEVEKTHEPNTRRNIKGELCDKSEGATSISDHVSNKAEPPRPKSPTFTILEKLPSPPVSLPVGGARPKSKSWFKRRKKACN